MPSQRIVWAVPAGTSPGLQVRIAAPSAARTRSTRTLAGCVPPSAYESSAGRRSPKKTLAFWTSASTAPAGGATGAGRMASGSREARERVPSARASATGPPTAVRGTRATTARRPTLRGVTDVSSASPAAPRKTTSPIGPRFAPATRTSPPGYAVAGTAVMRGAGLP